MLQFRDPCRWLKSWSKWRRRNPVELIRRAIALALVALSVLLVWILQPGKSWVEETSAIDESDECKWTDHET